MPSYLHKQVSGIATKNNKLESQSDARLRGHDGVLLRVFTVLQPLMRVFLCDLMDMRQKIFIYVCFEALVFKRPQNDGRIYGIRRPCANR